MTIAWNPSNKSAGITLSNSNCTAINNASGNNGVYGATAGFTTGKYYYEATIVANDQTFYNTVGVALLSQGVANLYGGGGGAGVAAGGELLVNGSNTASLGGSSVGTVVGIAVDLGAGKIWARLNNGLWDNNALDNPATGAGGWPFTVSGAVAPAMSSSSGTPGNMDVGANFGATAYANAAPAGFGNWAAGPPPPVNIFGTVIN